MKRLLFLVTEDWYFCVHWLPLAMAARDAGYDVGVACRVQSHEAKIRDAGITLHRLRRLSRSSRNPAKEIAALSEITRLYRTVQPDLVHHIALKPVVYGSIAARRARVPSVVNLMAGLGYVFSSRDLKARMAKPAIEAGFRLLLDRPNSRLVTQNPDDFGFFVRERMIDPARAMLIAGAGVDFSRFLPAPEPQGVPLVVLPARMLRDKGVVEFVEAARLLRRAGTPARLALVGVPDTENPACIPERQLAAWRDEGVVEWWGWRDDMATVYRECAIVCLPSWREGLPTTLVEAAASARPVVTCDVPGCRDVVRHGENGLLVAPRDAEALAAALTRLLSDPALRKTYGEAGRGLAAQFSAQVVNDKTLALYRSLVGSP